MTLIFLSIGSNLGDRESHLKNGIQILREHGVRIARCASIYETEPKDVENQPWFLNTMLEGDTNLPPRLLLEACLSVERQNQRVRTEPKSARTLDIDIIFYGDQIIRERGLTIPHPRFSERNFVLVPLMELVPDFVDPNSRRTIADLRKNAQDSSQVRRCGAPLI